MALRPMALRCKPAFDPVLLAQVNYLGRLVARRRGRLDADDDLSAEEIAHLPYPAWIGRVCAQPARHSPAAASVPRWLPGAAVRPLVSIIIPNRDSPRLIGRLLQDLETRTDYAPFETIVIDNGSTDPTTLSLYAARAGRPDFRSEITPAPFNFAAMVNRGAALARGEALLLLNNDVTVRESGWLAEMVDCLALPGVGVVGARLLFPDGRIQHAGVIIGLRGPAGHWFHGAPADAEGPLGRLRARASMAAVTGACLLTSRACWEAVGGMNATDFAIAYNDVDYCLRARAAGHAVVWTPFATLTHHEKASRGVLERSATGRSRLAAEAAALARRHGASGLEDPCFSPFWDQRSRIPRLAAALPLSAPRSFRGGPLPLGIGLLVSGRGCFPHAADQAHPCVHGDLTPVAHPAATGIVD